MTEGPKVGELGGSGKAAEVGRLKKTRRPRKSRSGTETSSEKALGSVFSH